jgi:EAL domain-containing protein (putative c-di-GMP-specific phosphodiesterase class I)/CheY-like chemotaxis protein
MISQADVRRARVLVVDDEPATVLLLDRILKRAGYTDVSSVTDARDFWDEFERLAPDLILLDINMPWINGYQVLAGLHERTGYSFVPVLVLTADGSDEAKDRALSAGAADFLTKPFSSPELLARMHNLLTTRLLYREVERKKDHAEAELRWRVEAEDELRRDLASRHQLITGVLADRAVDVVFQPIVDLETGGMVALEALARFDREPVRGPDRWFAEAHAVGLGIELEMMAVEEAAIAFAQLPEGTQLSLNASPTTIATSWFRSALERLPSDRIVIELTEHSQIDDYPRLRTALDPLRELGVRLAVDDAGAGYASLRHILDLRPDVIKLDRALVMNLSSDSARRALVRALVLFADEIGASVVGEGIETSAEYESLLGFGVGMGQGYYIARPGPVDDHLSLASQPFAWSGAPFAPVTERYEPSAPMR